MQNSSTPYFVILFGRSLTLSEFYVKNSNEFRKT